MRQIFFCFVSFHSISFGIVSFGFVSFSFVLFGLVSFCFVWFGLVWFCLIRFRFVWFCLILFRLVLFCLIQFCLIWFRLVLSCFVSFGFILFRLSSSDEDEQNEPCHCVSSIMSVNRVRLSSSLSWLELSFLKELEMAFQISRHEFVFRVKILATFCLLYRIVQQNRSTFDPFIFD